MRYSRATDKQRYFIRPAAVSARVITALTSIGRRGFCGSRFGSGVRSPLAACHNAFDRFGIWIGSGEGIGDTNGISFALGESTTDILGAAGFGWRIHPVRPKNSAM